MELTNDQSTALQAMDLSVEQDGFFDGCFSPRMALGAALLSAVAAIGGAAQGVTMFLAPDATTITKWVAAGQALGLVAALVALVAAYQALIDCEQGQPQSDSRDRELGTLRQQQQQLRDTADLLRDAIGAAG